MIARVADPRTIKPPAAVSLSLVRRDDARPGRLSAPLVRRSPLVPHRRRTGAGGGAAASGQRVRRPRNVGRRSRGASRDAEGEWSFAAARRGLRLEIVGARGARQTGGASERAWREGVQVRWGHGGDARGGEDRDPASSARGTPPPSAGRDRPDGGGSPERRRPPARREKGRARRAATTPRVRRGAKGEGSERGGPSGGTTPRRQRGARAWRGVGAAVADQRRRRTARRSRGSPAGRRT